MIYVDGQTTNPYQNSSENTKLDISCGAIIKKDERYCELEYSGSSNAVSFVMVKYLKDIKFSKTQMPLMNNFDGMIENLLCFQGNRAFPEKIVFTLITPKIFKESPKSRLYGYKMCEYGYNDGVLKLNGLLEIIKKRKEHEEKRIEKNWMYPENIQDRIDKIQIRWVTFEEIFGMKDEEVKNSDMTNVTEAKYAWDVIKKHF